MKDRYIVEQFKAEGDFLLKKYLAGNPHPEYRLVTVHYVFGWYEFVWEKQLISLRERLGLLPL